MDNQDVVLAFKSYAQIASSEIRIRSDPIDSLLFDRMPG
jgi:hypothetical protein